MQVDYIVIIYIANSKGPGKKAKKKILQLRDGATMTVKDISPSSSGEMIVKVRIFFKFSSIDFNIRILQVSFNFVKDNRFDQMAGE